MNDTPKPPPTTINGVKVSGVQTVTKLPMADDSSGPLPTNWAHVLDTSEIVAESLKQRDEARKERDQLRAQLDEALTLLLAAQYRLTDDTDSNTGRVIESFLARVGKKAE